MNAFYSFLFSLCFCSFIVIDFIKDKDCPKKNKYIKYFFYFSIVFIGCFIRVIYFDKVPANMNYDEASIGYEAFSIMNYGIDRNGMSLPIHLISWGSGQNVLYAYILIPFFKLLGVSIFSLRLPMLLISCFSIIIAHYLFKDIFHKYSHIALFLFIIMPWHIMKSRWGLESNIFPDMILLTIYLYNNFYKNNNVKLIYFNSFILGISLYAYGTSYVFVPIYFLLNLFFMYKNKLINIKTIILNILTVFIIGIPIFLFIIINYFNLDTISFFNITIPKLYFNRFESVTILKNNNFIINGFNNFISNFKLILTMPDSNKMDSINGIGAYYKLSVPFIFIGLYYLFKNRKSKKSFYYIISGLISSLVICFFVKGSIHRINTIWIFLIIIIIYGVISIFKYNNYFKYIIIFLYILLFLFFIKIYFNDYNSISYKHTNESYMDALYYIKNNNLSYKKLIITDKVNLPYIYYLFVFEVNPKDYLNDRDIEKMNVEFQRIKRIKNVYFEGVNKIEDNNVYILTKDSLSKYDIKNKKKKCFKYYCVIK